MDKKRKHGPTPKPKDQQRTERVGFYLTKAELVDLARKAGATEFLDKPEQKTMLHRSLGRYVRAAALDGELSTHVPEMNREAWVQLARSASNLNQLARALNETGKSEVTEVLSMLADFRASLIGMEVEA